MDIGIQIPYSLSITLQDPLKRRDGLRIETAAAPSIIAGAALCAVAVNVHVGESRAGALDVDYAVGRETVAAVGEACSQQKKNPLD